jgi:hypothetical protein
MAILLVDIKVLTMKEIRDRIKKETHNVEVIIYKYIYVYIQELNVKVALIKCIRLLVYISVTLIV